MWNPNWLRPSPIIDHIKNQYRTGLRPDGCLGYHGTSIQTLQNVLETGVVPGVTGKENPTRFNRPHNGDLYFWPSDYEELDQNAIALAASYATAIAQSHALLQLLKLDATHDTYARAARNILRDSPEFQNEYMEMLGVSLDPSALQEYMRQAMQYKGVVIGINSYAQLKYHVVDVEPDDDGCRLETNGEGLPYHFIHGIEAMGPMEREFLDTLA
ncbi:MAG: hypothetical protein Q8L37_05070 [Candidatus Gottesmanbacteria bacterium]|nr:hypothetical protein [Candidatus Gottesmanbacteria bacterium]